MTHSWKEGFFWVVADFSRRLWDSSLQEHHAADSTISVTLVAERLRPISGTSVADRNTRIDRCGMITGDSSLHQ